MDEIRLIDKETIITLKILGKVIYGAVSLIYSNHVFYNGHVLICGIWFKTGRISKLI
ncbi:hypothetical protein ES703_51197 [subsurface metagenome]